jgi:hypothetical protein
VSRPEINKKSERIGFRSTNLDLNTNAIFIKAKNKETEHMARFAFIILCMWAY